MASIVDMIDELEKLTILPDVSEIEAYKRAVSVLDRLENEANSANRAGFDTGNSLVRIDEVRERIKKIIREYG